MDLSKDNLYQIFKKHKTNIFIETGSGMGHGIARALDIGYELIHSIEIKDELWSFCLDKFNHNESVHLHYGDSLHWLPEILKDIPEKATFWLDAHMSGISRNCPTLEEIKLIAKHHIKDHIILIDDMADFGTEAHEGITVEQLKWEVLKINPKYEFSFDSTSKPNNVLICQVQNP